MIEGNDYAIDRFARARFVSQAMFSEKIRQLILS